MGKRKKKGGPQGANGPADFNGSDKPAFAADWFRDDRPAKPKSQSTPSSDAEKGPTLKDALGQGVSEKLARLKETIEAAQARQNSAQDQPSTRVGGVGDRSKPSEQKGRSFRSQDDSAESSERELSFAELFDPVDPDEESFEDMLQKSKMDWRRFK